MTDVHSKKFIASKILDIGINRVWIDPENISKVEPAITREDIRRLIKKGIIAVKPEQGTSRYHARRRQEKKRAGRLRGAGSKRGGKNSVVPSKLKWINTIRPIRRYLKALKGRGLVNKDFKLLYNRAGGGFFRNKAHLKLYMEKAGIGVKTDGNRR